MEIPLAERKIPYRYQISLVFTKQQKTNWLPTFFIGYLVNEFGGRKRVIISNTSIMGGKNSFLGIAYMVFGGICLILWVAFFIINKKWGVP